MNCDRQMARETGDWDWGAYAKRTATAAKTSLENIHLGNGYYFQIIASSSRPILGSLRKDDGNGNDDAIKQ